MADLSGELFLDQTGALSLAGISPNIAYSLEGIRSLALSDTFTGKSDAPAFIDSDALISPEPGISCDGEILGCFEELFEKIIISPRSKSCGFILSNIHWNSNVWNTHRNQTAALTGVDIQDSGNVAVNNPLGYPLTFAPLHARDLEMLVPEQGDATINAVVTFLVPGESGTDVIVTGMRIAVFAAEPDWSEPVRERIQYLTGVLSAYSAKEQRIALRKNPRTYLSFRVMPADAKTAAAMEALLYGHQARVFGVPFWPDARKIIMDSPLRTSVIYCDTGNSKFAAGGIVVLWRDFFTNEAATILNVAAGSITISAPLNGDWIADGRTYAIPALTGRWDGEALLGHLAPGILELDAAFQCDAVPDVAPAEPDQIYGYDVLDAIPNSVQDRSTAYTRNVRIIDFKTGAFRMVDRSGASAGRLSGFLWTLDGRNEIAAARAWFSLRKGQQKAFWLPTGKHDLIQASTIEAGNTNLVVQNTGYVRYLHDHAARRYLCFAMLDGSGARYFRKVVNASEGSETETLALDSALNPAKPITPGSCMISFMRPARLAADDIELAWHSRDVAETQIEMIELPLEASA